MQYSTKTTAVASTKTACLVLGIYADGGAVGAAAAIDEASAGQLTRILARKDFSANAGQTQLLYDINGIAAERLLLLGLGEQAKLDIRAYASAFAKAIVLLDDSHVGEATFALPLECETLSLYQLTRDAVQAGEAAVYRFQQCKSKPTTPKRPLKRVQLLVANRTQAGKVSKGAAHGLAIANGARLAKDLGNLPGNICTPSYLADQARNLGHGNAKLKISVLEEKQMERLGMGALLSVSRGSRQPAKLIVMEYKGGEPGSKPIALVGKGLTFDAGGISIKPAANMDEMKYDMCGAASVFGAIRACADLELPLNVVGVVPSSENLPDGDANKPGDIVTSMSGQTIEVLNTDAEGRLILCDALTYTERFKPEAVIDIATLTGACIIALGHHASGLMSNNDALADELLAAGQDSGDRAWRLPIWDDYQKSLDSNFADMANIGGRSGGAITAACFLERYTKAFNWAHLDIAGTAWISGSADKGATGRPVPLLMRFLMQRAGVAAE